MADTTTSRRSHAQVLFGDAQGVVAEPGNDAHEYESTADGDEHDEDDLEETDTGDDQEETMARAPRRSHADILFGDNAAQYLDIGDNMDRIRDREGLTADQVAAERRAFAQMALTDLGLDQSDARTLHNLVTEKRLTGGTAEWAQKSSKWREHSRRAFRERFADDADQLDSDVDALIQRQPVLGKLVAGELAGHPEIRTMLAGVVRRGPHGSQGFARRGPSGAHGSQL